MPLVEARIGWAATAIQQLTVPAIPGAYTAEVWLEDAGGDEGAPVTAQAALRRSAARPGRSAAAPAAGSPAPAFPSRSTSAIPPAPQPLSGIRGYAVSIDRAADGEPCAGTFACSEAETDLRGGVGGDSLAIAELPEGVSYVHAVAVSGSGMRSAEAGSAIAARRQDRPA